MGRKATVDDAEVLSRLMGVFREVGYEGASLAMLAEATGLQKASLYHRFPDGKEQMAREVLMSAGAWLEEEVLKPLREDRPARERIERMVNQLDAFYSGGKQACLLNLLSSTKIHEGPFTPLIKQVFEAFINTLAEVVRSAGFDAHEARARATRGVILLQGSLVFSRGTGSTEPFREFLRTLPDELLGQR